MTTCDKGRVERSHGTHQDRLIKKMGRKKIGTQEAGNRFLQEEYLADYNLRFARESAERQDYHRKAPSARELERVFCLETGRSISNDWVARYGNRYFQLERHSDYPPRQAKVTVCEWEDERIEIRYMGKARPYHEIAAPEPKASAAIRLRDSIEGKTATQVGLEAVGRPSLEEGYGIGDAADQCLRSP